MSAPKTDDPRLEREGERIVVTFTPTGEQFSFAMSNAHELKPISKRSARDGSSGYEIADVEAMATKLTKLVLSSSKSLPCGA